MSRSFRKTPAVSYARPGTRRWLKRKYNKKYRQVCKGFLQDAYKTYPEPIEDSEGFIEYVLAPADVLLPPFKKVTCGWENLEFLCVFTEYTFPWPLTDRGHQVRFK